MFSSAQGGAEAPGRLAATGPATDPADPAGPGSRPPRSRLRAGRSTGQRRALKPLYPSQDAEDGPQQAGSPQAGGGRFLGSLQLSSSDEELAAPAPPASRVPNGEDENEAPAPAQAPAEALEDLEGDACAAPAGPRLLKRLRRAGALPITAAARAEAAGEEEGADPGRASDPGGRGRARSRAAGWDSQSSSDSGAGGAGAGSSGAAGHSGGRGRLQGSGKGNSSGGHGAVSAAANAGAGNPFVSARTLEHGRQVRGRDQAAVSVCSALVPHFDFTHTPDTWPHRGAQKQGTLISGCTTVKSV